MFQQRARCLRRLLHDNISFRLRRDRLDRDELLLSLLAYWLRLRAPAHTLDPDRDVITGFVMTHSDELAVAHLLIAFEIAAPVSVDEHGHWTDGMLQPDRHRADRVFRQW